MKIIVQKFGGTSVRDDRGRKHALKHIQGVLENGYKVVCVVSAMGRNGDAYATDTLIDLVDGKHTYVSSRELDLMMACGELISSIVFSNMLNKNGIYATSLTGGQAGFITTDDYNQAKIIDMKVDRLIDLLKSYDVVVVAGFQGVTKNGDITTLGRGGSDTSASALGVALQAEYIDIFTDVNGIMTADPRIVKEATSLSVVTYNEICNMAYQGAKVIHPRSVEIAMNGEIPIRVRSTYSNSFGTLVTTPIKKNKLSPVFERTVTGIANVSNLTQIKVLAKEGEYDLQQKVFKAMANERISVDFINISPTGVAYTVSEDVTDKAINVLKKLKLDPIVTRNCAKIAVVGGGISGVPGVTSKIVTALSQCGITILQSADSHTTIWVLVKEQDMVSAVNVLHEVFDLHESQL
ncbi:MAG: aspartate kinase [Bacillaceae bacterium]